ncbi:MAG: hypothetical protein ACKO9Z_00370 [Planctomycetota bacterium]
MKRPSASRAIWLAWRLVFGIGLAGVVSPHAWSAPPVLFPFGGRKQEKPPEDGGKDGRRFSRNREFILPFNLTESEKSHVSQVHLFVRAPGEPWRRHDSLEPSAGKFRFMVPADGEYWFNIVTADRQGRLNPADTAFMPAALKVVVDTQAPLVELSPKTMGSELVAHLACDDRHLDTSSIRVEIREGSKPWKELQALEGHPRHYPVPAGEPCRLRAHASDLSGNAATAELSIGNPPPTVAATTPVPDRAVPSLAQAGGFAPVPAPIAPRADAPKLINSPRTTLEYKIEGVGPSGVSKVEIWLSSDAGKTWARKGEDSDMISPAVIDLPGEGVFGLIVHAVNGSGGGDPPPGPNTPPDVLLEVDSTRPLTRILGVKPSGPDAMGAVDIAYEVTDKNLAAQPVTLLVASRKGGPWIPLAQRVANSGNFRWEVPRHAGFEFHFRLEAVDLAGNIGSAETDQPVRFDTSRPKAKVVQVRADLETPGQVVPAAATTPAQPAPAPELPKMIELPGSPANPFLKPRP